MVKSGRPSSRKARTEQATEEGGADGGTEVRTRVEIGHDVIHGGAILRERVAVVVGAAGLATIVVRDSVDELKADSGELLGRVGVDLHDVLVVVVS
jgi:hypothetical protein